MKTDIQSKGSLTRFCGFCFAAMAASLLLALAWNSEAGGSGSTKTQPISVQFWLEDLHAIDGLPNRVVGDAYKNDGYRYTTDPTLPPTAVEPPYKDGIDYVSATIGRDQNIVLNLASQYKKPPIRHFLLNGGFPGVIAAPAGCAPAGLGTGDLTSPALGTVIPISTLQIYGKDHDDTPPGFVRHVNARLVFKDDAGLTWTVYYGSRLFPAFPVDFQYAPCGSCMSVARLPNTAYGKSRWRFWTEGLHLGYLYWYDPNAKPGDTQKFAGIVTVPMSGTIESLTNELEPSSSGYTVPEVPADCP